MPIGSFADTGKVEAEVITLGRALLEIEEIHLNYGEDNDNPAPYAVKNKDGELLFTSDPNFSALVKVVDDYGDGSADDKKFWDKFYLKQNKDTGRYMVGENSKFGMLVKAHPAYGPKHFQKPSSIDEAHFEKFQFEAGTEQKEDRSGKKLEGTRVAWKTIGAVPNRSKKKAPKETDEQTDKEVEDQLSEADKAKMDEVFEATKKKAS
jgi:hypothetical protein